MTKAQVVGEHDIFVLCELGDILVIDHYQAGQIRPFVANDNSIGDKGRELEQIFDFAWRYVFATRRNNDVLHSVDQVNESVIVDLWDSYLEKIESRTSQDV